MPHLSPALRTGDLLFLSGQLAFDDVGVIHGDIAEQTKRVLDRLAAVLTSQGLDWDAVVKAHVWLTDAADFPMFDTAFAARLGEWKPARSTVISALAMPGACVEIDLIASFKPVERL